MAELLGSRLRPARRHGLTSPDPVRTRHGPTGHSEPRPQPRNHGQAAEYASGRKNTPENSSWRPAAENAALGIQPVD
jgi:hypothetical protein